MLRCLGITIQGQKIFAAMALMSMLACSDGGSAPVAQLEPNRVDELALPRSIERASIQQLVNEADDYYSLYRQSGSELYYDRHWAAAEGARLILESEQLEQSQLEIEDLFDMPTEVEDDGLPDMPMGRA